MINNGLKEAWFKISDKIRFLLVGGFNFFVSYIIYSVLTFIAGENFYQYTLAATWIITSVISYTTQRLLVFPVQGNIFKQYIKCCMTWVFSYLINAFLLEFFVKNIGMNVYLSQLIACSAAAIFTYIMFKIFAFKK